MADLSLNRGDTGVYNLTIARTDPVTAVTSVVNLSGTKIWFTAKRNRSDADSGAIIRLGTSGGADGSASTGLTGITITDAANGRAQVIIPPSATNTLETQTVYLRYDIQVYELSPAPNGTLTTVASGQLTVLPDETRTAT